MRAGMYKDALCMILLKRDLYMSDFALYYIKMRAGMWLNAL